MLLCACMCVNTHIINSNIFPKLVLKSKAKITLYFHPRLGFIRLSIQVTQRRLGETSSLVLPPRALCLGKNAFRRQYIFKHLQGPEHLQLGCSCLLLQVRGSAWARRRAINVSTILTPDCLRIATPLQKGLCRQPQAWETHPLQGSCVCGWCSWHRDCVGLCFGAVGGHTARPEQKQPAEGRQGVRLLPPRAAG